MLTLVLRVMTSCALNIVELPCIFGPWQVQTIAGQISDTPPIMLGAINIGVGDSLYFGKDDRLLFLNADGSRQQAQFDQEPGLCSLIIGGATFILDSLRLQGDSLVFLAGGKQVKLVR